MYLVLLKCGHRAVHAIDGFDAMICPVDNQPEQIIAFETRAWHMRCQQCAAGKWTGSDEGAAYRAKAAHMRNKGHRQIVVDFMIPEHSKKLWRAHYGRRRTPARFFPKVDDNGAA
jgi:hypothetical protein